YQPDNLTSQSHGREKGEGAASWFKVSIGGQSYYPGPQSRWKTNEAGMARLLAAGRIHTAANSIRYVRFATDFGYQSVTNIWADT
ncbi:MAG TPA: hypothetical protein VH092_06840, partial [Urbifossiella sp.]|nr:hypothetical protein [Urbifossiella sp.]